MKNFLIAAVISLLLCSQAWAVTVTDDFNRADNTDVGSNWDTLTDACQIVGNEVRPGGSATFCYESWNANSFSGDQTAKIIIRTITGTSPDATQASVILKAGASGATFYRCVARRNDPSRKSAIQKWVGGSLSAIVDENTSGDWATGDELKCEVTGSSTPQIKLYKNGSNLLTLTDSSGSPLSGTRIGIGCGTDSTPDNCEIDNFEGGDLGTPPVLSGIFVDNSMGSDCTSKNYSIANRNCTGSDGNAYNTMTEGINAMSGGDTLWVRGGKYPIPAFCPTCGTANVPNGTSSNPTYIKSYPGETVTFTPSDLTDPWTTMFEFGPASQWIVIDGGSNRGIVFDGGGITPGGFAQEVVMLKLNGSNHTITNFEAKNLPDGWFSGTDGNSTNITMSNGSIHDSYAASTHLSGSTNCAQSICWGYPFYWSGSGTVDNVEVYNFPSYGMHGYYVSGPGGAITVKNSKFYNYGNRYWPTPPPNAVGPGDGRGAAILLAEGNGSEAYNNLIYHGNHGIATSYDATNTKIYSNTIYDMADPSGQGNHNGIYVGPISGVMVRNNIISETVNFINISEGPTGATYSHNLCGTASGSLPCGVGSSNQSEAATATFTSPGSDFTLKSGSLAIDGGFTLGAPFNIDKNSVSRPSGSAYDIGAYEFQAASGGQIYYVGQGTGDSDSNTCNAAKTNADGSRKRTVNGGKRCLGQGGDTLIIRAGTYNEPISSYTNPGTDGHGIPPGASWNAPTTIKAATGETVILTGNQDGAVLATAPVNEGGGCPASLCFSEYVIIEGITFDAASLPSNGVGAQLALSRFKLLNVEIKNAGSNCLFSADTASEIQILNSSIHDCGALVGGFGQNLYFNSANSVIEGNDIYNGAGWGIQIQYETGNNIHVRKNKVHNNDQGIVLSSQGNPYPQGANNNFVYNNLVYNNTGTGIAISVGGAEGAFNNTVVSNTVYGHTTGLQTSSGSGNVVRNNIVSNNTTHYSHTGGTFTASNNLCSTSCGFGSSNQTEAAADTFNNAGAGDFTLKTGSLARDNGFTLGSPYNIDFLGNPRPNGAAYDIGAYEFAGQFIHYVAKTGSDSNTCTQARSQSTPKLTIAAGIACLAAGDTLEIKVGTYTETIADTSIPSGSASLKTTIKRFGSDVVTVNGNGNLINLTNNRSHVVFDGLILDGANQTTATHSGLLISSGSNIRFTNGEIKNVARNGVQINAGQNSNEVLNSNIHDNERLVTGLPVGSAILASSSSNTIEGNTITNAKGDGIKIFDATTGTTVTDGFPGGDSGDIGANWDSGYSGNEACQRVGNEVRPTTDGGFCYESWNANTFSGDQTAQVKIKTITGATATQASALVKASAPPTTTFYRCVARRNDATAKSRIQKVVAGSITALEGENGSGDWAADDVLKCTVTGVSTLTIKLYKNGVELLSFIDSSSILTGTRIGLGCGSDTAASECEIDDFEGGSLGGGGNSDSNIVRKNRISAFSTLTPGAGAGIHVSDDSNDVYNNVIFDAQGPGIKVQGTSPTSNELHSNTIYGLAGVGITVESDASSTTARNNIVSTNTSNIVNNGASSTFSNNLCEISCGVGSSNQTEAATTTFTDLPNRNFHLKAGSAAINNGFTLGSPFNVDFDGEARPIDSNYDIGADETTAVTPELVAWYKFDDGAGTTAADSSGNGFHGTLSGGMSWLTTDCKVGTGCIRNNGTGTVVVADANKLDLTSAYTVMGWVSPQASFGSNFISIVVKNDDGTPNGYYLYANNPVDWCSGQGHIVGGHPSGNDVCGNFGVPIDQWVHFAVSFDGSMLRLYINGILNATHATSAPATASANTLEISASQFGENCNCKIDEVKIYNYKRTDGEILAEIPTARRTGIGPIILP